MSITGDKGIVKECLFYCKKTEEFWCVLMHDQACTLNSNESQNTVLGLLLCFSVNGHDNSDGLLSVRGWFLFQSRFLVHFLFP